MANRLISFSACWRFCFWLRALHSRRTSNNIRLGYGLYNRQARQPHRRGRIEKRAPGHRQNQQEHAAPLYLQR